MDGANYCRGSEGLGLRQTGSIAGPGLRGKVNGDIVFPAEVTTSQKPDGGTDSTMARTLKKLSVLPCKRIYCVRTPNMRQRADTKTRKAGYDIEVRLLGIENGAQPPATSQPGLSDS